MNIPKISIIVPIYKVESYIHKCIDSILVQVFTDFELILVDDGSPDNCGKICDEYASKDIRIKVIHKENGGLVSARKKGIETATGKYIGFVDSDDWIGEEMYKILYDKAIEIDADVVSTGHIYEKETSKEFHGAKEDYLYDNVNVIKTEFIPCFLRNHIKSQSMIYTNSVWSKLYKRQLLIDNIKHLNEKASYGEDMLLNYVNLIDAKKIAIIGNSYYYHYRCNSTSMLNAYNKNRWEEVKARIYSISKISEEKKYYCIEINIHIGWLVYITIKYYLHSIKNFKEKYFIVSKIINENPDPEKFALFSRYITNPVDKIYIWLIQRKMYKLVIILMNLYDKFSKR